MITKLTRIENIFVYHHITIIKDSEICTIAITASELEKIETRAERMQLLKKRSTLWSRLKLAALIIIGR